MSYGIKSSIISLLTYKLGEDLTSISQGLWLLSIKIITLNN
jgi:hypothetical protein